MKASLLKLLVCPLCQGELGLTVWRCRGAEISEGHLRCLTCRRKYAITRGIPRFVDDQAYAASFGLQWRYFSRVQLDSHNDSDESAGTLRSVTGLRDDAYAGRLVLDAGVGMGRFAEVVAQCGGEVVGIDLSDAVDAAYDNLGTHERVHLVQADLFAMPFRPATFDLCHSIGVLHHTPDPAAAFLRLVEVLKPGGDIAIYVYGRYGIQLFSSLWRALTTRLPRRLMLALCALAIPLYPLYRLPILGKLLHLVAPISLHPNWRWRWLDTFDWYTPFYQWKFLYPEVASWFRAAGCEIVAISDGCIRMAGRRQLTAPASAIHLVQSR